MYFQSLVFILLSCISVFVGGNVQCRDENNKPVDWYVLYKLPQTKNNFNKLIETGQGYIYITSRRAMGWQISHNPINGSLGMLANTINLTGNPEKGFWAYYNDQGNVSIRKVYGHTKGVLAGDTNGGFWLVHSIPKFINGTYPPTGLVNGQTALCVSFKRDMLDIVGHLMACNTPKFWTVHFPRELKNIYPKIETAVRGEHKGLRCQISRNLISGNGSTFKAFAKYNKSGGDLYGWVADTLKVNLYVESWQNGQGSLVSNCAREYKIWNVKSLYYKTFNLAFNSTKDHSKFAISGSVRTPIICIGDINRMASQMKRGGGTVCIRNEELWKSYDALPQSYELCNNKTAFSDHCAEFKKKKLE